MCWIACLHIYPEQGVFSKHSLCHQAVCFAILHTNQSLAAALRDLAGWRREGWHATQAGNFESAAKADLQVESGSKRLGQERFVSIRSGMTLVFY